MTENELITKALEDAYAFVKKQERTNEKDELLIDLFKAKILLNNLTIQRVSQQRELLSRFLKHYNQDELTTSDEIDIDLFLNDNKPH